MRGKKGGGGSSGPSANSIPLGKTRFVPTRPPADPTPPTPPSTEESFRSAPSRASGPPPRAVGRGRGLTLPAWMQGGAEKEEAAVDKSVLGLQEAKKIAEEKREKEKEKEMAKAAEPRGGGRWGEKGGAMEGKGKGAARWGQKGGQWEANGQGDRAQFSGGKGAGFLPTGAKGGSFQGAKGGKGSKGAMGFPATGGGRWNDWGAQGQGNYWGQAQAQTFQPSHGVNHWQQAQPQSQSSFAYSQQGAQAAQSQPASAVQAAKLEEKKSERSRSRSRSRRGRSVRSKSPQRTSVSTPKQSTSAHQSSARQGPQTSFLQLNGENSATAGMKANGAANPYNGGAQPQAAAAHVGSVMSLIPGFEQQHAETAPVKAQVQTSAQTQGYAQASGWQAVWARLASSYGVPRATQMWQTATWPPEIEAMIRQMGLTLPQ